MQIMQTSLLLGALVFGTATAADYSVGIVELGSGGIGPAHGLNLYSISHTGVDLVDGSPFVFRKTVPNSGDPYDPVLVAMSPAHDYVYVAYLGFPDQPILVQFKITPKGLQYRWRRQLTTGDYSLQGSTIGTSSNYLIENTYPEGLWVHILDEAGKELVVDAGSDGDNLVSGHVDPNGKYYYSCRYLSSAGYGAAGAANAVAVFKLNETVNDNSLPLLTSTDPVFVQSECN